MTTIACNKEEIASDLQYTNPESGEKWKGNPKVFYFEPSPFHYPTEPFYIGFAGTAQDMITIADYFSQPEEYEELPEIKGGITGLVLTARKKIFIFDHYAKWLPVKSNYAAIGSGAQAARGALDSGKTPRQAVQTAMKLDAYTGFGVKSFTFK